MKFVKLHDYCDRAVEEDPWRRNVKYSLQHNFSSYFTNGPIWQFAKEGEPRWKIAPKWWY